MKLQNLSYKTLFTIFFFAVAGIIFLLKIGSKEIKIANAAWWNSSWDYRVATSITASSSTTNQYVKITLNTSSLISGGKMQNDCDDIRVTDGSQNLLTHFVDGDSSYACNTSTTSIYVLTTSLASGANTFYVYYGNSSATNIEPTIGTATNPSPSCKLIKNHGNGSTDGLYYLTLSGNTGDTSQLYCNMTTASGGWTLIFQRRGGNNNTESCQSNLNSFLRNTCGSTSSIGYTGSYSVDIDNVSNYGEFLVMDYNSGLTLDSDDAFIIHSTSNIFPNSTGSLNNIAVTSVCDVNNSNCDTTSVYFLYTGNSWYNSSLCNGGYANDTSLPGNYGYCQNGISTSYNSNNLFGNRDAYSETKLWAYSSAGSKDYMERVFVREDSYSFSSFTSSTQSEEAEPTPTNTPTPTPIPAPNSPSTCVIDQGANNSVFTLKWADNSSDETGFKVYKNGALLATLGAGVTSYADSPITAGTSYAYKVVSYYTAGGTSPVCDFPVLNPGLGSIKFTGF